MNTSSKISISGFQMTDAAVSITQSAVEQFTKRYLTSLGASIEDHNDCWIVSVPNLPDLEIPSGETTLVLGSDKEGHESEEALHPESDYFHRLLEDATSNQLVGSLRLTETDVSPQFPEFLLGDEARVCSTDFYPYYDRSAVVVVFQVSIETVSAYETELLRVIAIDSRTNEPRAGIAETYSKLTAIDQEEFCETNGHKIREQSLEQSIQRAKHEIEEEVEPQIAEVHKTASTAANTELEEFRQLQRQRVAELQEEVAALQQKSEALSEEVKQTENHQERIKSLQERKEVRSQLSSVKHELAELQRQQEQGFPDQQRKIRDRHAVEVVIRPAALTHITYEVGDLDVTFEQGTEKTSILVGYGCGAGLIDKPICSQCGETLTEENCIYLNNGGVLGSKCCVSKDIVE